MVEKAERVHRGRGRQADDEGVEIFEHLPPRAVDRAVALVGDDQVEGLDRDRGIVGDEALGLGPRQLECGSFFVFLGEFLAGQHRIDPLDGRDDDRAILVEAGRAELLHAVEFGKQRPVPGGR